MEYLFPLNNFRSLQELLQIISSLDLLEPFHEILMLFVSKLSDRILLDKGMRTFPELMAVASWMRKGNIVALKQEFDKLRANRLLLPRGLVLHFAPSNVDTIFIYSWILALLLGNSNIIRISQKNSPLIESFLKILNELMLKKEFHVISKRLLIIRYSHEIEITTLLSAYCNVRVIWGGDKTINTIRRINLPPRSSEIVFADRFSSAAIKAAYIFSLSDKKLEEIVNLFIQDTLTYNQQACSSPKIVFWIGKKEIFYKSKQRFWNTFKKQIKSKAFWKEYGDSISITRLSTVFNLAAQNKISKLNNDFFDLPCCANLKQFDLETRSLHTGEGLFLESEADSLDDLIKLFNIKDQTLSVCGFDANEMFNFAYSLKENTIDRIVPFGMALQFSHVWDGYNLLLELTREISIVTKANLFA